jgi:DNA-binding transcriptional LysR family regulator
MAVYGAGSLVQPQRADGEDPTRGLPWVGFDGGLACAGPGRWMDRHVAEAALRLRSNTLLGAAQAVRAGIGCAVLPCFVGAALPGVLRLGPVLEELAQPLWLLVHPDLAGRPRIRRALDALAARLSAAAPLLCGEVGPVLRPGA